jgi:hypothetical protein
MPPKTKKIGFWRGAFSENGDPSFARLACGYMVIFTSMCVTFILVWKPILVSVMGSLLGGIATIIGLIYGAARLGAAGQAIAESKVNLNK